MSQVQLDWLESSTPADAAPSAAPAVAEADWLEIEVPKARVPYDELRFSCMRGTGRVWACDGEYVAYRPYNHSLDKEVNTRTAERHANFLASEHYQHVGTFDEVQVFKLLDGSPFKRNTKTFIPGQNLHEDVRQAAIAACDRDWVLYHDILDAVASGLKTYLTPTFAASKYEDCLATVFVNIEQRGGPTRAEVDAGFGDVRKRRGYGGGKIVAVPGIPLRR